MKAYLDNSVVHAIVEGGDAAEFGALDRLLVAHEQGKVELVTSELTLEEIKAYRGLGRPAAERAFRLLEKVPIVRWDELMSTNSYGDKYAWTDASTIQNVQVYDALRELGLEEVDARHVFVAVKQPCDAFLTCKKVVLQRAPDIAKLWSGVVQRPSDFVASHGW